MIRLPFTGWLTRNERRLVPALTRGVAGIGVAAIAVTNPAVLTTPGATASSARPSLVANRTLSTIYEGTTERGRRGVETSARLLVASLGGLPTAPGAIGGWVRGGDLAVALDRCPSADVVVSWRAPVGEYTDGGYIEPLGPIPTDATERVNGVVVCRSSRYAFLGFEATWERGRWLLAAVPSLDEETGEPLLTGEAAATGAAPAETVRDVTGAPTLPPAEDWAGAPLEDLAAYAPQTACDPTAKAGVLGFRDLLLTTFPGSRNLGIGRACEAPGVSEHKEGRAFDWGVNADDPAELAAAEGVLAWMLGSDETGQPYAIARRLGLMYVIWDGRIWSSFLAEEGWRPYVGRSTHREHIHFSFDWNGALAQSSFWRGGRAGVTAGSQRPDLPLSPMSPKMTVPPAPLPLPLPLPEVPLPPSFVPTAPEPAPEPSSEPPPTTTTTTAPESTTTTTAPPESTTTTTTSPPPPTLLTPPTTIRLGSL